MRRPAFGSLGLRSSFAFPTILLQAGCGAAAIRGEDIRAAGDEASRRLTEILDGAEGR